MNINKSDGWIKLHKSMMSSDLWNDENGLRIFTTLLLMAHHEDNQGSIRFNGKQVHLKKGQLEISRSELADFLNMSQSTVRNVLIRLKQDSRVDSKTDNHSTIITICNWEKYQSREDNKRTAKRTTRGQPQDNRPLSQKNKEIKNIYTSTNNELKETFDELVRALGYARELVFTTQRKIKLKARLQSFTTEQLKEAATRISQNDFMQGKNDSNKKFGTIDYLLRNDEKIDDWLNAEIKKKEVYF